IGQFPSLAAIAWYRGGVSKSQWGELEAYIEAAKELAVTDLAIALFTDFAMASETLDQTKTKTLDFLELPQLANDDVSMKQTLADARSALNNKGRVCLYDARFFCKRGILHPATDLQRLGRNLETRLASYLSDQLGFTLDTEDYHALRGGRFRANWDFRFLKSSEAGNGTNMAEILQRAQRRRLSLSADPEDQLRLMIASGYHDLVTPFYAVELALRRVGVPEELMTLKTYEGGHMMYLEKETGYQLAADIRSFIRAEPGES
ncbi:MAG: hypothetical protein AAGB16_05545, partial [Pseudomonadota bacterium]